VKNNLPILLLSGMFGGLCWLLAHPPKFVWLNSNFKKRYDAKKQLTRKSTGMS
jgi:hypothetical protein